MMSIYLEPILCRGNMSTAGLLAGIAVVLLAITLIYLSKLKAAEISKQRTIVSGTVGGILLGAGISLVIAKPEDLLTVAIAFLLFSVSCLIFTIICRKIRAGKGNS